MLYPIGKQNTVSEFWNPESWSTTRSWEGTPGLRIVYPYGMLKKLVAVEEGGLWIITEPGFKFLLCYFPAV